MKPPYPDTTAKAAKRLCVAVLRLFWPLIKEMRKLAHRLTSGHIDI